MTEMENILLGTLLGDGSIYKDKGTYRVDISHGEAQKAYLLWKAAAIGHTGKIQPYVTGYGSKGNRIRHYDRNLLPSIADIVLRDGKKVVTDRWTSRMDVVSLAVWYQDDGSWGSSGRRTLSGVRSQRYSVFNTQSFDDGSLVVLCDWLKTFGLRPFIRTHKGKYRVIRLGHSSTVRLWGLVAPYLILDHKVDRSIRPGVMKCGCGVWIEKRQRTCSACLVGSGCSRQRLHRRKSSRQVTAYWVDPGMIGSLVR